MGTISKPETTWKVAEPAPASQFAAFPEYPKPIVQMLFNRGLTDDESAASFLDPVYTRDIHDPSLLSGVEAAVRTIVETMERSEPIVVHGDYDADGLTATAVLVDVLTRLGASVRPYVPSRYKEGYGVAGDTLTQLIDDGTKLVITVDCGISSAAEIAAARKRGLRVIVTDHHAPPKRLPVAEAVINPNLPGESYPNKALTGVGVAFKLAQALLAECVADRKRREAMEKWLLDLVAIGTVADLAELRGENRALVKHGLLVLRQTRRPGLRELLRSAGIGRDRVDGRSLGYAIAPRLNAPGRLGQATDALRLLLAEDSAEASRLAAKLEQTNQQRRKLTSEATEQALRNLPALTENDRIIVLEGSWKSGVVGLVAGQLSRDLSRPAVVIERGETLSRGSVRSIPGFHVAEALEAHAELLETFGGHAQAGGFSIESSNLKIFRERLTEFARQTLTVEQLRPSLDVEGSVGAADLDWPLLEHLERFEPFGVGNPQPNLLLEGGVVRSAGTVGAERTHLKLSVTVPGGRSLTALGFGLGDRVTELSPGSSIQLVGRPVSNEFNGQRSLEWYVADFRA